MMHTSPSAGTGRDPQKDTADVWDPRELAKPQSIDEDALELLPLFASELERALASFRTAVATNDVLTATKLCHRIKGSAATYGYRRFAEVLAEIETAIGERRLPLGQAQPLVAETIALIAASVRGTTLPN